MQERIQMQCADENLVVRTFVQDGTMKRSTGDSLKLQELVAHRSRTARGYQLTRNSNNSPSNTPEAPFGVRVGERK